MRTADGPPAAAASRVTVFAPAKINLFLHVIGRRADGYHELDSLVAFADVGDRITATPGDGLTLAVTGPFAAGLDVGEDNLVMRAARRLAAEAGIEPRAAVVLEKSLPLASGIGGGSADAAATLRALDTLWGIGAGNDTLTRIGLELGADVPACLFGRPARVSGIGERLCPASIPADVGIVLANSGVPVATGPVFAALDQPWSPAARLPAEIADADALATALGANRNDLTAAALGIAPVIADLLAAIDAMPGCLLSRMSGSGATCFGLFANPAASAAAAAAMSTLHPQWWVAGTRLLSG